MSYINKILAPGERIVYIGALHWVIYLNGLLLTVLGGILGHDSYRIVGNFLDQEDTLTVGRVLAGISFVVVLIGIGMLIAAFVRQSATELVITDRRVVAKYGIVARVTFEIMVDRITGANFDQTIVGRLLNYGTILVHGAGGEISPIDLVSDPQGFHRALMGVINKARPATD
jgi:uncharacterized membrane protein YdbT with pleckstrin-like domain